MGKLIDLTGRRFGRLTVLNKTDQRHGSSVIWHCKCDCGREVDYASRWLLHGNVVSCGCVRRERANVNLARDHHEDLGQIDGTNLSRLRSSKPQRNNRSGVKGVSWQPNGHGSGGHWRALIYYKGRRYDLGLYDNLEDARSAYDQAKQRLLSIVDKK